MPLTLLFYYQENLLLNPDLLSACRTMLTLNLILTPPLPLVLLSLQPVLFPLR